MPTGSQLRCTAFAVLVALAVACGDDDPAATDSPCDDAETSCVIVNARSSSMTHAPTYDAGLNQTTHVLSWDLNNMIVYGGGRHIVIQANFDPPIMVQYDHPEHHFELAGGPIGGCADRFAKVTNAGIQSDWTPISAGANFSGACTTGASSMEALALFGPLATGNTLTSVRIEFTVPETYDAGSAQGTPVLDGNLALSGFALHVTTSGNSEFNPPAWPEGVDLPIPR